MPVYQLTSPKSKQTYKVEFDGDPNEDDIEEVVAHFDKQFYDAHDVAPSISGQGQIGTAGMSFWRELGNVGVNTVGGAARLLEAGSNVAGSIVGGQDSRLGRLYGDAAAVFGGAADFADEVAAESRRVYPTNPANKAAEVIGSGAAQGVGMMAPGVALKAAGAGAGVVRATPLAMGFAMSGGEGVKTAREMGASEEEALGLGLIFGTIEAGFESIGGIGGKGMTDALMDKYRQSAGEMVKEAIKTLTSEPMEEVGVGLTQDAAQWILAQAAKLEDPERPGFTTTGVELPEFWDGQMWENRAYDALGGLAGGTVAAIIQTADNLTKPAAPAAPAAPTGSQSAANAPQELAPAAGPPPPPPPPARTARMDFNGQPFLFENGQWLRPRTTEELAAAQPNERGEYDLFTALDPNDAVDGALVAQLEAERARRTRMQPAAGASPSVQPPTSSAQTAVAPSRFATMTDQELADREESYTAFLQANPEYTGAQQDLASVRAERAARAAGQQPPIPPEPGVTNAAPPTFTASAQPAGPPEGKEAGPSVTTAPAGGTAASGQMSQPVSQPAKSTPLPDPSGADLISAMQAQRLRLGGPARGTPEWEWYEQLEREAAQSPLRQQSAEAAARRGEVDDPKALLAWLHQNHIVDPAAPPANLDEAAAILSGQTQAEENSQDAFQAFDLAAAELGPAILDAIESRRRARDQGDGLEAMEREQLQRERQQARDFLTHAYQSTGPERSGYQLANETAEGSVVRIHGRSYLVAEADPTAGTVALEDPSGEHGYQYLTAEDSLPIEAIDGREVSNDTTNDAAADADTPFSLAPAVAFPQVQNPARRTIIDRLKARVGTLVKTGHEAADRYADAMLSYYADRASNGRLHADDWRKPLPPIYRPGYRGHRAAYDAAAEAARAAVQEAAQDLVNEPGYSLSNGNSDSLSNPEGTLDSQRGKVRAAAQDRPLPSDPQARIDALSAGLRRALGLPSLPERIRILHDSQARDPKTGRPWKAKVEKGQITLNAAFLESEADALWNLEHELAHEVFRSGDRATRRAWKRLEAVLAKHPDITAEVEALGYREEQRNEETTVRLAQKLDAKGPWTEAWEAFKEALWNFLSGKWGDIRTNFTDRAAAAFAARAIMNEARDSLQRTAAEQSLPAPLAPGVQWQPAFALARPDEFAYNDQGQITGLKPEVAAEIKAEEAEIERVAKANGTWMKTPNGKPSKLNERQWVQVRTRRFKEWFGDWQGHAEQRRYDDFVNRMLADGAFSGSMTWRTFDAEEISAVQQLTGIDASGFTHEINANQLRHARKQHPDLTDQDLRNLATVLDSWDYIEQGTPKKGFQSIRYVKQMTGGTLFYVERLFPTSRDKSPRGVNYTAWKQSGQSTRSATSQGQRPKYARSAGTAQNQHPFSNGRVNPESVSKVVDENGEPMVAYHGTDVPQDFDSFNVSTARSEILPNNGLGHFFTPNSGSASYFAEGGLHKPRGPARIIPVFLNIKNPTVISAEKFNEWNNGQPPAITGDGIFVDDDAPSLAQEIVARNGNQIKSATANAGTFSQDTEDTRYAYADESAQPQGHAQPLDAPVLTPEGYRPIGSLTIGAAVTGPDSQSSTVTGVYPQGRKQVFKLTLADGRTVRATDDHLWLSKIHWHPAGAVRATWQIQRLMSQGHKMEIPVLPQPGP